MVRQLSVTTFSQLGNLELMGKLSRLVFTEKESIVYYSQTPVLFSDTTAWGITCLGKPFALFLDVFVLIEINEVHHGLPTDAWIAVQPVCLFHVPVTKPALNQSSAFTKQHSMITSTPQMSHQ